MFAEGLDSSLLVVPYVMLKAKIILKKIPLGHWQQLAGII